MTAWLALYGPELLAVGVIWVSLLGLAWTLVKAAAAADKRLQRDRKRG